MNTYAMVFLAFMLPNRSFAPPQSFLQNHTTDILWAGVYQLTAGRYRISFTAPDGHYYSPSAHLVILKASADTTDPVSSLLPVAERLWKTDPIIGPGGKGIVLKPGSALYRLSMDSGRVFTDYAIAIEQGGTYIFFLEAAPSTISAGRAFLMDRDQRQVPLKLEWTR